MIFTAVLLVGSGNLPDPKGSDPLPASIPAQSVDGIPGQRIPVTPRPLFGDVSRGKTFTTRSAFILEEEFASRSAEDFESSTCDQGTAADRVDDERKAPGHTSHSVDLPEIVDSGRLADFPDAAMTLDDMEGMFGHVIAFLDNSGMTETRRKPPWVYAALSSAEGGEETLEPSDPANGNFLSIPCEVQPPSIDMEAYTGSYYNPLFGYIYIRLNDEELGMIFERGVHLTANHFCLGIFATESEIISLNHLPLIFEIESSESTEGFHDNTGSWIR